MLQTSGCHNLGSLAVGVPVTGDAWLKTDAASVRSAAHASPKFCTAHRSNQPCNANLDPSIRPSTHVSEANFHPAPYSTSWNPDPHSLQKCQIRRSVQSTGSDTATWCWASRPRALAIRSRKGPRGFSMFNAVSERTDSCHWCFLLLVRVLQQRGLLTQFVHLDPVRTSHCRHLRPPRPKHDRGRKSEAQARAELRACQRPTGDDGHETSFCVLGLKVRMLKGSRAGAISGFRTGRLWLSISAVSCGIA